MPYLLSVRVGFEMVEFCDKAWKHTGDLSGIVFLFNKSFLDYYFLFIKDRGTPMLTFFRYPPFILVKDPKN